ncbi:28971556-2d18-44c5-982f-f9808b610123 [Thermothielavioides terrestris]|uniref:28971556-2d18-44c5-982f-f9808b610123 n=1 Tax=Thermothielavioides terrestris TaxID=2587410 RepID=A0A446BLD4_9PEZI|nr:28971556-2d18-44c5-982f-f9808b610123 [Thermothielavioides terrestris]
MCYKTQHFTLCDKCGREIALGPYYLEECSAVERGLPTSLSIGVRNYDASKAFYTAVLAPLGLRLVYDSAAAALPPQGTKAGVRARTLGYGVDKAHELLNMRRAEVEFHPQAMGAGGLDNGQPGGRKHYGGDYFAV